MRCGRAGSEWFPINSTCLALERGRNDWWICDAAFPQKEQEQLLVN